MKGGTLCLGGQDCKLETWMGAGVKADKIEHGGGCAEGLEARSSRVGISLTRDGLARPGLAPDGAAVGSMLVLEPVRGELVGPMLRFGDFRGRRGSRGRYYGRCSCLGGCGCFLGRPGARC